MSHTKTNKRGWIVVTDGRSLTTNAAGRPPAMRDKYIKHLTQNYASKTFSSYDVMETFKAQLEASDNSSKAIVRVGMALRTLEKLNIVKCVGIKDNHQRGNNIKLYKLCKGVNL